MYVCKTEKYFCCTKIIHNSLWVDLINDYKFAKVYSAWYGLVVATGDEWGMKLYSCESGDIKFNIGVLLCGGWTLLFEICHQI